MPPRAHGHVSHLHLALLVAGAAVLAACGGSAAPTQRVVTVTAVDDIWTGPGTSHQAASTGYLSMEVHPEDGSAAIPGVASGPGVWRMTGVPPGGYTLRASLVGGNRLVLRSEADALDLGRDLVEPLASPASDGTVARLSLGALQAWEAADRIQLYSPGAMVWDLIDPSLAAGATSGSTDYDWTTWLQEPLQATDALYALQLRGRPVGSAGDVATSAVAAASATGVTMTDGGLSHVGLAFGPPADAGILRARWSASAFDQAVPGAHPAPSYWLAVMAQPAPASVHPLQAMALLQVTGPTGGLLPDRDDGDLQYGRVAPAGWTEYVHATFTSPQTRTTPGSGRTATLSAGVTLYAPIGAVPDPIAPAVSGVRAVTVGGKDAAVAQAGVGLEPILAWTAPATGLPTSVHLAVRKLSTTSSVAPPRAVVQFVTTGSQVKVPPGVLVADGVYVATVTAVASPADRPSTAPWRTGMPSTEVTVVTEVFTP